MSVDSVHTFKKRKVSEAVVECEYESRYFHTKEERDAIQLACEWITYLYNNIFNHHWEQDDVPITKNDILSATEHEWRIFGTFLYETDPQYASQQYTAKQIQATFLWIDEALETLTADRYLHDRVVSLHGKDVIDYYLGAV